MTMKRSGEEYVNHPQKKNKHDYPHGRHGSSNGYPPSQQSRSSTKDQRNGQDDQKASKSYEDALNQLPASISEPGQVPAYSSFTVSQALPALPPIKDTTLSTAPFTHKSTTNYNRATQTTPDLTYERLEFLGDAYIELIASRLLFSRFGHLSAGQQSQLRELLVKNETLAEFSRLYGFENRVQAGHMETMHEESKLKGNKGFNKVLGDVFEAYVAAAILSDAEEGFAVVEKWLTALWAPKLVEATKKDRTYAQLTHEDTANPRSIYNPTAKAELQQRIFYSDVKLSYEVYKDSVELKGDQLGQNRHFIALYLTGYGHERKLLGKGEGKNKVEAGNWAATEAMHGKAKEIVNECVKKLKAIREEKKKAKDGK